MKQRIDTYGYMMHVLPVCALFLFAAALFYVNSITPLSADDLIYSCNIRGEHTSSLSDIYASVSRLYRVWSGRIVANTLDELFLYIGEPWFSIGNTLCYLALALSFAILVKPFSYAKWSFFALCLWFIVGAPNNVIFWKTGSCNYLWPITLLLVYVCLVLSQKKCCQWLSLALAFFAGNGHEAAGLGAVIVLMMHFWFTGLKKHRCIEYLSLVVLLVGVIVSLAAPGNVVRSEAVYAAYQGENSLVTHLAVLLRGLMSIPYHIFMRHDLESLIIVVAYLTAISLNCIYLKKNGCVHRDSVSWLAAATFALCIPVAVNQANGRAMFFGDVFSLLSISLILEPWVKERKRLCFLLYTCALIFAGLCMFECEVETQKNANGFDYISRQLARGNRVIVIDETMTPDSRFTIDSSFANSCLSNQHGCTYFKVPPFAVISNQLEAEAYRMLEHISFNESDVYTLPWGGKIVRCDANLSNVKIWVPGELGFSLPAVIKEKAAKLTKIQLFPAVVQVGDYSYIIIKESLPGIICNESYTDGTKVTRPLD